MLLKCVNANGDESNLVVEAADVNQTQTHRQSTGYGEVNMDRGCRGFCNKFAVFGKTVSYSDL